MAKGDHIYVERLAGVYAHHGIDTGDGWVIHYTGKNWRDPRRVQRTTVEDAFVALVHEDERAHAASREQAP